MPASRSLVERGKARQLWQDGQSFEDVARELSIPASSIRNWKKREKWSRAESAEIVPVQSEEIEIPATLADCQEQYTEGMTRYALTVANHAAKLNGEAAVKASDKVHKADQVARKALKIETEKPYPVINIGILASKPSERLHSLVRPTLELAD